MAKRVQLTNYWISYSDLMAGLLFVMLAIIVISNSQYKKKNNEYKQQLQLIGENIELREKIARELTDRFNKHNINYVQVDPDTGDIKFLDTEDIVWFKYNRVDLLPKARLVLDEVMPIYLDVLFDENITEGRLDRILVEGHASQEYDIPERYLTDLELSEGRAFSVGTYILRNNLKFYEGLKAHMVTLGRSFADAKHKGLHNPSSKKDRNVVVKYTLQYEKMMRDLIQLNSKKT